jgi:hypothetical protein
MGDYLSGWENTFLLTSALRLKHVNLSWVWVILNSYSQSDTDRGTAVSVAG